MMLNSILINDFECNKKYWIQISLKNIGQNVIKKNDFGCNKKILVFKFHLKE